MREEKQIEAENAVDYDFKEYRGILKKIQSQNKLISIYTDCNDPESFSVGFINIVQDDGIILNSLLPNGEYDGYLTVFYENIIKIEYDTQYGNNLQKLSTLKNPGYRAISNQTDNIIETLLLFAKDEHLPVYLDILEDTSFAVGFISSVGKKYLQVESVDKYGNKDGICLINIEDITSVACDSENEHNIAILMKSY